MNIFVCQTPFQLFYASQIISYFEEHLINDRHCIIHSGLNLDHHQWSSRVFFQNMLPFGNSFNNFIQIKKTIKLIDGLVKECQDKIEFFIPHIGGLIPNYIFHNKRFLQDPKVMINFYYEGILYFYDFKEDLQVHHLKRYFTSMMLGFSYRYSRTILPYDSIFINHIYTPHKEITKGKADNKIEIGLKKYSFSNRSATKHILILGGPIPYLEKFYYEAIKDIINQNLTSLKIYYKGHSSFETNNKKHKKIFKNIAEKYNLLFEEIETGILIELVINSIRPATIYSYYSSALLNIKLMSNFNYDIFCYFDKTNLDEGLKHIFHCFGIEVRILK